MITHIKSKLDFQMFPSRIIRNYLETAEKTSLPIDVQDCWVIFMISRHATKCLNRVSKKVTQILIENNPGNFLFQSVKIFFCVAGTCGYFIR